MVGRDVSKRSGVLCAAVIWGLAANLFPVYAAFKIETPQYTLEFSDSWEWDASETVLLKGQGLLGTAYIGLYPAAGNAPGLADSITTAILADFGGTVVPGETSEKTLGAHIVAIQKYTYDSLPLLEAKVKERSGIDVPIRNGSFQVYSVRHQSSIFTLLALPLTQLSVSSLYRDAESAMATLLFTEGTSLYQPIRSRAFDRETAAVRIDLMGRQISHARISPGARNKLEMTYSAPLGR